MTLKGSFPWSPKHITYPHPEPEESTFPSSLSNIYFNIIFPAMSISYKHSHSFTIPQRNIYSSLFFPMYVTCSANWSLLELIILTLWTRVQITKLLIAFSWAQWYFLLLGSNITNHVVSSSQIIRIGHKRFSTELKWVSIKVWNPKCRYSTVLWWNVLSGMYIQIMYIPEENKHNDWVLTWTQTVQQHGPSQLQFAQFFQRLETCPALVITRFLPSREAVESAVTLALHHGLLQPNIYVFYNPPT